MQKDPGGQKLALALGGALIVIAVGILFVVRSNKNSDTENTATAPATTASGDLVELQMWDQEEADNTVIIDGWLRKFESTHPNVKITRQTYPNEDLRTKYTMAAAGAQAPARDTAPGETMRVTSSPAAMPVRLSPRSMQRKRTGGRGEA